MADQACFLNNYYPDYSVRDPGRGYWPVTYEPSERLDAGRDPDHPDYIFSPLHDIIDLASVLLAISP